MAAFTSIRRSSRTARTRIAGTLAQHRRPERPRVDGRDGRAGLRAWFHRRLHELGRQPGGSVSYLGWAWNVQNCNSFPVAGHRHRLYADGFWTGIEGSPGHDARASLTRTTDEAGDTCRPRPRIESNRESYFVSGAGAGAFISFEPSGFAASPFGALSFLAFFSFFGASVFGASAFAPLSCRPREPSRPCAACWRAC